MKQDRKAFVLSFLCGVLGLSTLSFFSASAGTLGFITILAIPFVFALSCTRSIGDSIVLLWINEMFFGGTGHWFELGPVSIRWLLLLLVIASGVIAGVSARPQLPATKMRRPEFRGAIVFFGLVVPTWLVAYSVVVKETPFWLAVSDVNYLLALLAYFAVRRVVRRRFPVLREWLMGGVLALALFFIALAIAPVDIVRPIFMDISAAGVDVGTTASGINRAAMLFQILLLLGVFAGMFQAMDGRAVTRYRILGFMFFVVSILSYVLMFLRGPLLGILVVSFAFLLAATPRKHLRSRALRVALTLVLVSIGAFALYSVFVPEAMTKFAIGEGGVEAFISEDRIEQARVMLKVFGENLAFGMGAGVAIPGYARSGGPGLAFELQYLMLLYRFGLAVCFVLLLPILWFFVDLFRVLRDQTLADSNDGRFMLAALMSLLTVFVAGATNPYLTAVFTPFFVILYLTSRELVLWRAAVSARARRSKLAETTS